MKYIALFLLAGCTFGETLPVQDRYRVTTQPGFKVGQKNIAPTYWFPVTRPLLSGGPVMVYRNGILQAEGEDFYVLGQQVCFQLEKPGETDMVVIAYHTPAPPK